MGTLHPEELRSLWDREDLSIEAAIGQLLQNLAKMQTAIDANNISLYRLRSEFDGLVVQLAPSVSPANKM